MNIEALLVIGGFTIVLGVVLLVPGLWWARRKSKAVTKETGFSVKLTMAGWVYVIVLVTLLVLIFSFRFLFPDVSAIVPIVLYMSVFALALVVDRLLAKRDIKLFVKVEEKSD